MKRRSSEITDGFRLLNSELTLDGFLLVEALESVYSIIVGHLLYRGATDAPDLYCRVVPLAVFDAAVGAGWFPLAESDFDPKVGTSKGDVIWQADFQITEDTDLPDWVRQQIKSGEKLTPAQRKQIGLNEHSPRPTEFTKNQKNWIVQFGDYYVSKPFIDSFYDLLQQIISFHMGEGTKHGEHLKSLPSHTTDEERKALLANYKNQRTEKGLTNTMKQIAEWAAVDYSDLMKWRNGNTPDSSAKAKRISLLLRFDERNEARSYRTFSKDKAPPLK